MSYPPLVTEAQWQALNEGKAPPEGLQARLDAAADLVRTWCGWHIAPSVTETLRVDGSAATIQNLPTMYLTDVTAISDAGQSVTPVTGDGSMIDWSKVGQVMKRCGMWTARMRGVEASIVHGYEQTPLAIQALVCAMADDALAESERPAGVVQETKGPFSITYKTSGDDGSAGTPFSGAAAALLARYVLPGLHGAGSA